jgi:hypothetical protein
MQLIKANIFKWRNNIYHRLESNIWKVETRNGLQRVTPALEYLLEKERKNIRSSIHS